MCYSGSEIGRKTPFAGLVGTESQQAAYVKKLDKISHELVLLNVLSVLLGLDVRKLLKCMDEKVAFVAANKYNNRDIQPYKTDF
ncbi:MAG: hypothetical protein ABL999_13365 [Pyrinomonadaceae bacterium]